MKVKHCLNIFVSPQVEEMEFDVLLTGASFTLKGSFSKQVTKSSLVDSCHRP